MLRRAFRGRTGLPPMVGGYRGGERVCDHLDVSLNSKHASEMRWQMDVLLKMAIASVVKRTSLIYTMSFTHRATQNMLQRSGREGTTGVPS
jgi:hypothetical protein